MGYDPNEDLRKKREEKQLREARKQAREGLSRGGEETPGLPQASDELSPPGASLKVPGGWDIAQAKKRKARRAKIAALRTEVA